MDFELAHEHRMLVDLVERFVADELLPLEKAVLAAEAAGGEAGLSADQQAHVDARAKELGLWGLDAPEALGGADLPHVAVMAVNIALGATAIPYFFPPDSPNLRMMIETADDSQRVRYLAPYAAGALTSAMAISEPDAGADPRRMRTRAVRVAEGWRLRGTKIWISRADTADFLIVMALSSPSEAMKPVISAFLVDRDTPGVTIGSRLPMIGGHATFEVFLDDVVVPAGALLGREGAGFGPMQTRLATRRLEIAGWCIGAAERALKMMVAHAAQRVTFGAPLSDRQAVQWWIADAAMAIRSARLLAFENAWRLDRGEDVSTLVSMIKVQATELASRVIDQAMQVHGAMGMSKELPLHLMAARARLMRIYDGPSEVHRWVVARDLLRTA